MITLEKQPVDNARTSLWRSRWAAIGAAVAVSLGAGGMFVAQAAPGTSESTIVSVTPERILDTRNGNDIGLPGPFVSAASQKLQVTGPIATATGNKIVVPAGATGVLLNVTPVSPTAAGFISIRPGVAAGAATTSSLNFTAGGISPNSVQVSMPTAGANAGKIDITFDAYGVAGPTTDVLIDVVGYTTNIGLQQLVADVAAKANSADVYTKAQSDAAAKRRQVIGGYVDTTGIKESSGAFTSSRSGVGQYFVNINASGAGLPASVFPMIIVASPSGACPGGGASADSFSFFQSDGLAMNTSLRVSTTNAAGVLTDCGFSFHANFQGSDTLTAPADVTETEASSGQDATCYNEPTGTVCG